MDFVLVTGQPGAGKTLNTIKDVETRAKEEGRPVYYYGIPELTLDWHKMEEPEVLETNPDAITPLTWFNCPDGCIIVIDEAHRIFKPHDKLDAPHIKWLSTYRHRGISMYFISQAPMLVTSAIRDWVQPHIHYRRLYGRQSVVKFVNEWTIDNIRSKKLSENAQITKIKLDPKWYGVYKSASQHNSNKRLNRKVLLALILPAIFLPASIWLGYSTLKNMSDNASGQAAPQAQEAGLHYEATPGPLALGHQPALLNPPTSPDDPLYLYAPRIAAMPETAPAYDELRKPQTWPRPQCLINKKRDACSCYTQQATVMQDYPDELCRTYATRGYFDPTRPDKEPPPLETRKETASEAPAMSQAAMPSINLNLSPLAGLPPLDGAAATAAN